MERKEFGKLKHAVEMDDLCTMYENDKRIESKSLLHYLDFSDYTFKKIMSAPYKGAEFICAYKLCMDIINSFLDQPEMKEHKKGFSDFKKSRTTNDVISFLWYFEHIDGCHRFYRYEGPIVMKELKKWCKSNGLEYKEPAVFAVDFGHSIPN